MALNGRHIDGTERSGRAQVFTRAATDTPLGIDDRNLDGVRVTAVRGNHQYGSRRAMAGTVATIYAIGQRNTVLFYPYGVTDARGRFFGNGYRTDGSCGTDFAASGTFRTAIATLIGHFGLHQSRQVGGGAEHSVANPAILFYIVKFCLVRSVEGRSTPLGHADTHCRCNGKHGCGR